MPDVFTVIGFFCGWCLIACAFGWLVGRIIKFGDSDPADWDELESRRRAKQNGIRDIERSA